MHLWQVKTALLRRFSSITHVRLTFRTFCVTARLLNPCSIYIDSHTDFLKVGAKNCYITPHIAWATLAARKRLLQVAVDNVASFLAGKLKNVVNGIKTKDLK